MKITAGAEAPRQFPRCRTPDQATSSPRICVKRLSAFSGDVHREAGCRNSGCMVGGSALQLPPFPACLRPSGSSKFSINSTPASQMTSKGNSPKSDASSKKAAAKPASTKEGTAPAAKKSAAKPAAEKDAALLKKKSPASESRTASVRRTGSREESAAPAPKAAAAPTPAAPAKPAPISDIPQEGEIKHSVFVKLARQKLLDLKDSLMDSMTGTASETLRNKAEGSEASAFGMHQADAGTDAYDRDFALSLLSQEQDALYEIEEALKRIEAGTYGICEACNKRIPQARLEALPFARLTIDCQQQYEKEVGPNSGRRQVRSLFGLMGSEDEDEDGDEESSENEKES